MAGINKLLKVNETEAFGVLDLASVKGGRDCQSKHSKTNVVNILTVTHKGGKRDQAQARANQESGGRMGSTGKIGGAFQIRQNPSYIAGRTDIFESLWTAQEAARAALPDVPISITLPSGDVKSGFANKTTPYDVAKSISQGLADNVVIARVEYTSRADVEQIVRCDEDEEGKMSAEAESKGSGELWDLNRPLAGDCTMTLLKFDDPEAKTVSFGGVMIDVHLD
jgi:hypothetical protein